MMRKQTLLYAGLLYLAFVIYGSLVPLDFRARPLDEAWLAFSHLPYLDLGIESRADWVANILLFIPLTFIWLGLVWHPRSKGARILASGVVFVVAAGLSAGIEFTQLFFPPRTTSQNDIAAETIGALAGILVWWAVGEKVMRFFGEWAAAKNNSSTARHLLYLYLFFLFGYNLLPLDLTLSPVEIYHKWRDGKIVLVPFGFVFKDSVVGLYGMISDVVIWAPAAFLLTLASTRSAWSIIRLTVGSAALLEFLQLFVYTRVSSVTQIILSAVGALIGVRLARLFIHQQHVMRVAQAGQRGKVCRSLAWIVAIAAWIVLLLFVFWYPFNFHYSDETRTAVAGFLKVPFIAYYYGTEYRAATEVLHKTGFFFPLGLLLALAHANIPAAAALSERTRLASALSLAALMALAIEAGQAFLPGKNVDVTDWLLEAGGAIAGYLMMRRIVAIGMTTSANAAAAHPANVNIVAPTAAVSAPAEQRRSTQPPPATAWWRSMVAIFMIVMLAIWFITQSSYAPYNVRKLLATPHSYLSLVMLTGFICWTIGFPAWMALRGRLRARSSFLPAIVCHAVVAWILIRYAVPLEMIEKVAASPILGWPWEWELIGRFSALFVVTSIALTLAATARLALLRVVPGTRFWHWLLGAILVFPISYWIIISNAATDNLTELLANRGSIGESFLILSFMLILCFTGSALAAFSRQSQRPTGSGIWLAAVLILSFPFAYGAIFLATEQYIMKYGKVFSALQFLLSSDRDHYATTSELAVRYALFHCVVVAVIAIVQRPFFSGQPQQGIGLISATTPFPRGTRRRRSSVTTTG